MKKRQSSPSSSVWRFGGKVGHVTTWSATGCVVDNISELGPEYGYHPNASKTWLIVSEGNLEAATELFQVTGVSITKEGRRHLEAAIGTRSFVEGYVHHKVSNWVQEVERLSSIAATQPHAAYAALCSPMV